MKKNSVIILSTLLLGTTLLRADKFWEKKGSAEWTRKEVIRMMYKSPWAHRVEFRLQNPMSFEGDPGNSDRERLLPDPEKKETTPDRTKLATHTREEKQTIQMMGLLALPAAICPRAGPAHMNLPA
jgi:hypothetical protein